MFDRLEIWLKCACLILGALFAFELARALTQSNPLAHVIVPATPHLPVATNVPAVMAGVSDTAVRSSITNALTNSSVAIAGAAGKTNSNASQAAVKAGHHPGLPPELAAMGMGMGPAGPKLPDLPPEIRARIDKIIDSEILAPVIHTQPMALLGIAGEVAFLRAPTGQTGLLKESETLGEIKLLRIGTNRVLVEQDGEKKELTIFSGYGGESLLPKTTTNENSKLPN